MAAIKIPDKSNLRKKVSTLTYESREYKHQVLLKPVKHINHIINHSTLRDNRIELVRASWHELSISVSDVSLSDEGQYTCSLFTMPVKTSKAYLTVLGVPEKPQISGFSSPVMEGDLMQLTCKTSGSKPAADIRWFKNDKEIKDVKYLKEEDANRKTFTVSSTLDFRVDRSDDGVAVICRVDHESLNATPQVAMQVLEIHYTPSVKIIPSTPFPQEGQALTLTCESKGKPLPEPVLWTKDGAELPDPDRMVVSGRELNILFLNKTDNGTYRCEATNTIGQSSAEYVLIVHVYNKVNTRMKSFALKFSWFVHICSHHFASHYYHPLPYHYCTSNNHCSHNNQPKHIRIKQQQT
ncbi:hypothetical protein STEG23_029554, partial [Scotinomys teguina]